MTAFDSFVPGPERYWTGAFEDDITELGIRAAVEENDGGNRADIMLEDLDAAHPDLLGGDRL